MYEESETNMKEVICQYCGNKTEWVENKEIYGKNYGKSYMMYLCRPCDAYVGCHNNTRMPLGTLANKATRTWRKATHAVVDPLWKSGRMSRNGVYVILKRHFKEDVHVGESDIKRCKEIIDFIADHD